MKHRQHTLEKNNIHTRFPNENKNAFGTFIKIQQKLNQIKHTWKNLQNLPMS